MKTIQQIKLDAELLNARLLALRPDDRLEILLLVIKGYCSKCGEELYKGVCYCDRDD